MKSAANGNGATHSGATHNGPAVQPHPFGHGCSWCLLGITLPEVR